MDAVADVDGDANDVVVIVVNDELGAVNELHAGMVLDSDDMTITSLDDTESSCTAAKRRLVSTFKHLVCPFPGPSLSSLLALLPLSSP